MSNARIVNGHTVTFERRRYGPVTYTWAYLHQGDKSIMLGDPWPCINPKQAELEETVRQHFNNERIKHESESQTPAPAA